MDWTYWFEKMARRRGAARIIAEAQMRHVERAIVAKRSNTATVKREPLKGRERREDE
jgi:hypothetical protein